MISYKTFKLSIIFFAAVFLGVFIFIVLPPAFSDMNIVAAFAAGFVNPFATGYSVDVIACWFILAAWVLYESKDVSYGWLCLILGVVPGVAVGFAAYLLLREKQRKA